MKPADFYYSDDLRVDMACRMLGWARRHNLVRYKPKRFDMLAWIVKGTGRHSFSWYGDSMRLFQSQLQSVDIDFRFDHVSYWRQAHTGIDLVVSQPYVSMSNNAVRERIVDAKSLDPRADENLVFRFSWSAPSWYGPGTALIAITDAHKSKGAIFPYYPSDDLNPDEAQKVLKLHHDPKLKIEWW